VHGCSAVSERGPVSSERWRRLRAVYDAVSDAAPADRGRLLDELCAGEPELRAEAQALVDADTTPDAFLDGGFLDGLIRPLQAGDVLCERFTLLRQLGRGGMGEVWAATDRHLGEPVAIKTIAAAILGDEQSLVRFKREIQLARRVAHRNVCRVHDIFEDRGAGAPRVFLTMELLEGETLAASLKATGPLSCPDALWVLRQLADGLTAAHAAGIIHRDLKPANIMLLRADSSPRVVIMDFGLARTPETDADGGISQPHHPLGTPDYMAPEQITGADISPATDVYALGSILFEMLAGEAPFRGGNTLESVMRRAREVPRPLSGTVRGVTPRIDAAIARCLAFQPERRFQQAADVVAAVESTWPRPSFGPRRVRWIAGLGLALAAALAAVSLWPRAPRMSAEAARWYADAQQSLAEGATVRALNDIERAVNAAPAFAPAHAALAEVYYELDMPMRAQEVLLKANQLAPNRRSLPADDQAYIDGVQALVVHECDSAVQAFRARAEPASGDRAYRLMTLARAYEHCGHRDEAATTLAAAATLDPNNAAVVLRQARMQASLQKYDAALPALEKAEKLFRERGNAEGVGEVLATRGILEARRDRLDAADQALDRAADVAHALDEPRLQIRVLLWQAVVHRKRDDMERARALTEQALALAQTRGFETLALDGLFTAGGVHLIRNQFADAQALYERALAIADTYRNDEYRGRARLALASVFVRTMDADRALTALAAARPLLERFGDERNLRNADTLQGEALVMRGKFTAAIDHYSKALALARERRDAEQEALAHEKLAFALVSAGRYRDGLGEWQAALDLRRAAKRPRNVFYASLNIAETLSKLGDFAAARAAMPPSPAPGEDSTELQSQWHVVAAADALRQARYQEAIADARRAADLSTKGARERALRAGLIECVGAAHAGDESRSRELSAAIAGELAKMPYPALQAEAALAAAEAALVRRDGETAAAALADAERLMGAEAHEDRWRLLALKAAHDRTAPAAREAVAREIDARRLKWGERDFALWRQRPDVRVLSRMAGVDNGGPRP